jgi:CheY-like chemotaxis protein
LVVDDEPAIRDVIADILRDESYTVIVAAHFSMWWPRSIPTSC